MEPRLTCLSHRIRIFSVLVRSPWCVWGRGGVSKRVPGLYLCIYISTTSLVDMHISIQCMCEKCAVPKCFSVPKIFLYIFTEGKICYVVSVSV